MCGVLLGCRGIVTGTRVSSVFHGRVRRSREEGGYVQRRSRAVFASRRHASPETRRNPRPDRDLDLRWGARRHRRRHPRRGTTASDGSADGGRGGRRAGGSHDGPVVRAGSRPRLWGPVVYRHVGCRRCGCRTCLVTESSVHRAWSALATPPEREKRRCTVLTAPTIAVACSSRAECTAGSPLTKGDEATRRARVSDCRAGRVAVS